MSIRAYANCGYVVKCTPELFDALNIDWRSRFEDFDDYLNDLCTNSDGFIGHKTESGEVIVLYVISPDYNLISDDLEMNEYYLTFEEDDLFEKVEKPFMKHLKKYAIPKKALWVVEG